MWASILRIKLNLKHEISNFNVFCMYNFVCRKFIENERCLHPRGSREYITYNRYDDVLQIFSKIALMLGILIMIPSINVRVANKDKGELTSYIFEIFCNTNFLSFLCRSYSLFKGLTGAIA